MKFKEMFETLGKNPLPIFAGGMIAIIVVSGVEQRQVQQDQEEMQEEIAARPNTLEFCRSLCSQYHQELVGGTHESIAGVDRYHCTCYSVTFDEFNTVVTDNLGQSVNEQENE